MRRFLSFAFLFWIVCQPVIAQQPASVQELWADFDPRQDPLETEIIREWQEDDGLFRHVRFLVGTFKGQPARMTAIYGFPKTSGQKLPGVMHIHGGGQRGSLSEVKLLVARGYAGLSVNWGGSGNGQAPINSVEGAKENDPNTDWGAVDPTQLNVAGYFSMLPGPKQYFEDREHPKNNNWYLLTLGCRRGLTFLEQQPEVDPDRLGVHGFSMGGNLTMYVAGTDNRVKAAVTAVGGQGWRWEKHEFLDGGAGQQEYVRGDLDVFRRTLSFESYAPLIQCPVLHRSATNDFHGWMDDVYRTNELIPNQPIRYAWTPHHNHRLSPEVAVTMLLWLDHHLKEAPSLPETPETRLTLQAQKVPSIQVTPDHSWPVERCEIFYSVDPDPRARFWRSAEVVRNRDVFEAPLPLHSLDLPLFAFSNVYYRLPTVESMKQIPGMSEPIRQFCLSSKFHTITPQTLQLEKPVITVAAEDVIDDFSNGFTDWYELNGGHVSLRELWTRKVSDPIWRGADGDKLCLTLKMPETNHFSIVLVENEWRNYRGPRRTFACTREIQGSAGEQEIVLEFSDFRGLKDGDGPLKSWAQLDLLGMCAGFKDGRGKQASQWRGPAPEFVRLEWRGTE
ncbi:MAG: dienelactone hydrolase family protein [Planctomycetaceae bacterium]